MGKEYYKNYICAKCRYFLEDQDRWEDKCLMFYRGVTVESLRRTLAFNTCNSFRPPFVSHEEDKRMDCEQRENTHTKNDFDFVFYVKRAYKLSVSKKHFMNNVLPIMIKKHSDGGGHNFTVNDFEKIFKDSK